MKLLDKIFFGIIFGAVLPGTLFLAGWWGTFKVVPENQIFIYAFGGLTLGIIIDFFFIKKVISNLYEIQNTTLSLIYIFYSVCIFGFFMGVPVFNSLLGIPAGYYAAKRCLFLRKDIELTERYFKQTAIFTTVIILLASLVSASIALSDPFTAKNLKGMLNLNFEITKPILFYIIIGGGTILIIFQYYLTKFTAKIIYAFSEKREIIN
jgi:hypothetical protein